MFTPTPAGLAFRSRHTDNTPAIVLVAAQAHSAKEDRAVIISSRNFLRSLGGAAGLAIGSALFSNTLIKKLPSSPTIPQAVADQVKASVFSVPDLTGLDEEQKILVLDTYVAASRSVFYFWLGCIGLAWMLMWFIKDKGLKRKEEREEKSEGEETPAGAMTPAGEKSPAEESVSKV